MVKDALGSGGTQARVGPLKVFLQKFEGEP